jgi:large subunit ribosomal protein L24
VKATADKRTKMRVKKGDLVQVLRGKDRGKQGRVMEARPDEQRVLVENLNVVKRHMRPRPIRQRSGIGGAQIEPGGVIEKPAPIPVANVMVVCPTCGRPTRVGIERKVIKNRVVPVRVCRRADCRGEVDKY